jgi:peptidyl-prolyl cis-trans isomerase B (cyclophilin B)
VTLRQEREAARRHYERQQARRADRAARTRRRQQVAVVAGAVLLVVGGVTYAALSAGSDEQVQTSAQPSASADPSAEPTAGAVCPAPPQVATRESGTYDKPELSIDPAATYTATLTTNCGTIGLVLNSAAPETINSFRFLAGEKFFDGTSCHRLTTEGLYVLQCGDPTGTGGGGPGYGFGIENAPADGSYPAGTVAMARTQDPDSNGSQFFLVYKDSTLPVEGGGYSIFGSVTEGLDVVQKVADAGTEPNSETPAQPITLESVVVTEQGE